MRIIDDLEINIINGGLHPVDGQDVFEANAGILCGIAICVFTVIFLYNSVG